LNVLIRQRLSHIDSCGLSVSQWVFCHRLFGCFLGIAADKGVARDVAERTDIGRELVLQWYQVARVFAGWFIELLVKLGNRTLIPFLILTIWCFLFLGWQLSDWSVAYNLFVECLLLQREFVSVSVLFISTGELDLTSLGHLHQWK
jgi:hypothetical protein